MSLQRIISYQGIFIDLKTWNYAVILWFNTKYGRVISVTLTWTSGLNVPALVSDLAYFLLFFFPKNPMDSLTTN